MSPREDTILSEGLENQCEVREVAPSGRYLAVTVSCDAESYIYIIDVSSQLFYLFYLLSTFQSQNLAVKPDLPSTLEKDTITR